MGSLNMDYILNILPHRYPFLLVDRIEELHQNSKEGSRLGYRVRAIKNVTFNEFFFQGHFPGKPIMPGVLVIEAMAQAGALAAFRPNESHGYQMMIAAISQAKFRFPVIPGMQLILRAEIVKDRGKLLVFACKAEVDGKVASEVGLMAHVQKNGKDSQ